MELRNLEQLVAVAEAGNLTRAAESLRIAQPALSVAMRKLETELGAKLFVREPRGVRLTPVGEAVVVEARRTLAQALQVAGAAAQVSQGSRGRLRVGFVGSATIQLLQQIIPRFTRSHPGVELVLDEARSTGPVLQRLREEAIDVGIVRTPLSQGWHGHIRELHADRFVAAVPAVSAGPPNGHSVELSALSDEPFVMYREDDAPGLRSAVMLSCHQSGFVPRIAHEAVQISTVLCLVESGLGVGLVPSLASLAPREGVRFHPLAAPPAAARVGLSLIWDPVLETPQSKAFRLCAEFESPQG